MRAAVLEAPCRLVVRDVEPPSDDAAVIVRPEQVGVCGTDRKVVDGAVGVPVPRVIGHELVGRVVGGRRLGQVSVGDRVLVDPSTWCGVCSTCRRGLVHLCPRGGLMGRDVDGALAELVAAPCDRLHAVPESLAPDDAALLQVLGTCVHAHRQLPLFPVDRAAVVGLGVAGLLHVQLFRARGVATVVGVGRSASKRGLAETLGATATCTPEEAPSLVASLTGGDGADVVVEAAGTGPTVSLAVALAALAATVSIFGVAAGSGHEVPLYEMYRKELRVMHPRAATGADYDDAIALMAAGALRGAPLVTDHAALEDAAQVFATWPDHPERLKVVFESSAPVC